MRDTDIDLVDPRSLEHMNMVRQRVGLLKLERSKSYPKLIVERAKELAQRLKVVMHQLISPCNRDVQDKWFSDMQKFFEEALNIHVRLRLNLAEYDICWPKEETDLELWPVKDTDDIVLYAQAPGIKVKKDDVETVTRDADLVLIEVSYCIFLTGLILM